jgi:hypothetical protein
MAERGDEQPVRILRVDVDHRDHLRVVETEMRPGLSGVGRLVDAVADGEVRPNDAGSRTDIDDVRIRRRDAMAPIEPSAGYRRAAATSSRSRRPPNAAVVEADIERRSAGSALRRARDADRRRRPDLPPVQVGERIPAAPADTAKRVSAEGTTRR